MRAIVLGAAAGGGLPQWNCGCANCNEARRPGAAIKPQTQSSLAVSGDGESWAVLNASPDIRHQLANAPALHPRSLRDTPIRSVLLTNGDIDHVAGLFCLREMQPFTCFATAGILEILHQNPLFGALNRDVVRFEAIELGAPFELAPSLIGELFPVPGKVPLYLEGDEVVTDLVGEQTVGVRLTSGDHTAWYIPGCARMSDDLVSRLSGAELVFFDGTVFEDDEMIRTGTGVKTGRRMGHLAMNGADGSVAAFEPLSVARKIYVHMNNTNPVWRPDSSERAMIEAAGWEVGQDGMEIAL